MLIFVKKLRQYNGYFRYHIQNLKHGQMEEKMTIYVKLLNFNDRNDRLSYWNAINKPSLLENKKYHSNDGMRLVT